MTLRHLFFLLLFIGSSNFLFAQDLIVTTKNDSIKCKIVKDDIEFIYYVSTSGNRLESNQIKTSEVKQIRRNYTANSSKTSTPANNTSIKELPKGNFRIYASGGFSYLSAKSLSTSNAILDDYLDELKSGYNFTIGANYYGRKNLGLGIKYLGFNTRNNLENVAFTDSQNNVKYGNLSDNVLVSFYAASFVGKAPFYNNKLELLLGLSVGYVSLKNNSTYINPISISGNTIGYLYEIGFDYKFNDKWAVGIDMNIFQAIMRKYTYETAGTTYTKTLDKDKLDNISRFDISGGIRMYFNR